MTSSLPAQLAQRVFATHPAPVADAVWALETSTVEGKREALQIAARTLLRLVTGTVLAARLQRGGELEGDSRRARELMDGWRTGLLSDAEWLELMREILRSPAPDFPLPRLMELTQGADGARFVVAMKRLLQTSEDAGSSIDDAIGQFGWLLERLDTVWADGRLVVPRAAPADSHARQSVIDLVGVDDHAPFEQRELAPNVRLPPDRPVLATEDGKPRVSLYPVLQWKRDVPGLGDGLFFLEGCEPESELYRSYPSLMELRQPRPEGVIAAESAARKREMSRGRRRLAIGLGVILLAGGALGLWHFLKARTLRLAEAARVEAIRQSDAKEQAAEAAWHERAAKSLARAHETLQKRCGEEPLPALHRTSPHHAELLKLAEAVVHSDTPQTRSALLLARLGDQPMAWRTFPGRSSTCVAVAADGRRMALTDGEFTVTWRETETGKRLSVEELVDYGREALAPTSTAGAYVSTCAQLALSRTGDEGVALGTDGSVWRLGPSSFHRERVNVHSAGRIALTSDGSMLAYSTEAVVHLHKLVGHPDPPPLTRHTGDILDIAFSPDGHDVATASADGSVRLWDTATSRELKVFGQIEGVQFTSVTFSPDGRLLAAASSDKSVRLWEVGGRQVHSVKLDTPATQLAFVSKGSRLALLQAGGATILDLATDTTTRLEGPAAAKALATSNDGRWLLVTGAKETRLWDLAPDTAPQSIGTAGGFGALSPDGRYVAISGSHDLVLRTIANGLERPLRAYTAELELPTEHKNLYETKYGSLAFAPDGRTVASIDNLCTAQLWEVDTAQTARYVTSKRPCNSGTVAFSNGGDALGVSTGSSIGVIDAANGTSIWSASTSAPVVALAFTPDDATLFGLARLAGADGHEQEQYVEWAAATGKPLGRWPTGNVEAMALSADGRTVFAAGTTLRSMPFPPVGEPTPFEQPPELDTITTLALSPRGDSIFGGGGKGIWWWDVSTRRLRGRIPSSGRLTSLAVSPDGETLLANNVLIPLTEVFGPEARALPSTPDAITRVACSPDGKLVALADATGLVRLIDAATGDERGRATVGSAALSLAFSPDNATLAIGAADKSVSELDVALREVRGRLTGAGPVTGLAYLAGGQLAAGAGNAIAIWDTKTGKQVRSLTGHLNPIVSMVSSQAAPGLVSAATDGTVKLWNPETGEQLAELRAAGVKAVAYASNGRLVAFGRDDGQIMLRIHDQNGAWQPAHAGAVGALAVSPDGAYLASAGGDDTLKLWRLSESEGTLLVMASLGVGPRPTLAFSSDGRWLVVGHENGSAQQWNVTALISFHAASARALANEAGAP